MQRTMIEGFFKFMKHLLNSCEISEQYADLLLKINDDPNFEKRLIELKNKIRVDESSAYYLNEFQKQFEGVHKDFLTLLKEKHPGITSKELRLCGMLKMNLSTNEICDLLALSPNTLKSSRYRIHKKMNLPKGAKLQDYIISL